MLQGIGHTGADMPKSCTKHGASPREVYGMRDGVPVMVYPSSAMGHRGVASPPTRTRPAAGTAQLSTPAHSSHGVRGGLIIPLLAMLVAVIVTLTVIAAIPMLSPQHSVADVAVSVVHKQAESSRAMAQEHAGNPGNSGSAGNSVPRTGL